MFTTTPSRVEIKPDNSNNIVDYMYYFDRKLIVVCLILSVSDGING
jgi:hypothetical protein